MRKVIFLFAIVAAMLTACSGGKKTHYGEKISPNGAIASTELVSALAGKDSLAVKVTGPVNEACKKKGCWMTMDLGQEQEMMVRFKDYGFFVPTDAGGSVATIEGWARKEEVSVEMLRHYAEDAGKSNEEIMAITQPETQITFLAHGVLLKDGASSTKE